MSTGEILYGLAIVLFAWMTFAIVRGNFQRKFDDEGNRIDLKERKEENGK